MHSRRLEPEIQFFLFTKPLPLQDLLPSSEERYNLFYFSQSNGYSFGKLPNYEANRAFYRMNMDLSIQIRTLFDCPKGFRLSIFRPCRLPFLLLVLPLLFIITTVHAGPVAGKTVKRDVPRQATAEQQYQTAKATLQRLEDEGSGKKDRNSWLKIVQTFRMIHTSERKNFLGAPSLFMVGKAELRMHQLFNKAEDLKTAQEAFVTLADLYPGSPLADDALFFAGECAKETSGDGAAANALYQKVITLYPQGDFAARAKERLATLVEKNPASGASGATVVKSNLENSNTPAITPAPAPQVSPAPPIEVAPIKYWSTPEYTRIVVQTAAPVQYSLRKEDKNNGAGKRLILDLTQGYLSVKARNATQLRDGLLQAIHPRQVNEQLARIDLDLQSVFNYTIFTLPDPYRVVVDIYGLPQTAVAQKNNQTMPSSFSVSNSSQEKSTQAVGSLEGSKTGILSLIDQKKRAPEQVTQLQPVSTSNAVKDKLSLAQQLGLGVRKIVIDPGHGGKDPGAVAFGLKEKDIVLTLSRKLSKILRDTYHYEIVLTRSKDVYVPLEERTAIANANKSDLFISLHINAHNDQARSGIETYFLNLATDANAMRVAAQENASSTRSIGELQDILNSLVKNSKLDESASLARFVHTNLVTPSGRPYATRDLGVKQAPFFVLIGAQMPAILAEISFLTNPKEAKLLQSEEYLNKVATQMAAGIAAYVEHRHTAAAKF